MSEEEWEEVFKSFKKQKLIVSRPSNISVIKEKNRWKISLTFGPTAYLKSSTYKALNPLWNYIKEKILSLDPSNSCENISWEIIRER